jgi:hypothetical protein
MKCRHPVINKSLLDDGGAVNTEEVMNFISFMGCASFSNNEMLSKKD